MEGLDALKISEQKKLYIVQQLNPVLEEMVAECIHMMPPDPVPFMLEWLEKKKVSDEDKLLTDDEKTKIKKENEDLQESIRKVKSQMQDAAKLAKDEEGDPEAEEEEEEEDDEPPPDFFKENPGTKCRQSVSAEAYGDWNQKKAFVPPVIMKNDEQKERLRNVLSKSFLFSSLENQDLTIVIGAMKEVNATDGEAVITQGDAGDFLFVIEAGKLDCLINTSEGEEKVVKTCEVGDVFGELALLYNCPRAATVKAREACVLWQLDRDTFNHIVKEAAQKKRQRYDTFLAKVPLLHNMDAYERSQLADALKVELFNEGDVIVKAGESGNKFYIIEEGEAEATKAGDAAAVMQYKEGDYFGELALIRNQPRAATVTSKGSTKALSLDGQSFKRLLKLDALLERSKTYE